MVTPANGQEDFPATANEYIAAVETLAVQSIESVKSASVLRDAFWDYSVENGKVIEQVVLEYAKDQAYNRDDFSFAPTDPKAHVRYFNNYDERQFSATLRRDDIRAITANKGQTVEDTAAAVLDTMTQAESNYYFNKERDCLLNENVPDFSTTLGGVPTNMKGVLYTLRRMYKAIRYNNKLGTGMTDVVSSAPESEIRIAISDDLLNLIDVVELASLFNMSKEELFGKIVSIPSEDITDDTKKYTVIVYDRHAMGRSTRIREVTTDESGKGRFINYYLTVSRALFYSPLFKALRIDCSAAAKAAKSELITAAD